MAREAALAALPSPRERHLRRAVALVALTTTWNVLEGVIAITAAVRTGSIALLGFGFDSVIETASGAVVGWRLWHELKGRAGTAALERRTARIAGALLLILAAYLAIDAGCRLLGFGEEARESALGLGLTALSLIAMQFLGRAKLREATALGSRALRADAIETVTCAWLSLTTLLGLALNFLFHWSWADPLAALAVVPLLVREGREGLRGESCCGCEK
ncbi:MAG: cation transporter [Candidatus Eisenbacteria bacterium]